MAVSGAWADYVVAPTNYVSSIETGVNYLWCLHDGNKPRYIHADGTKTSGSGETNGYLKSGTGVFQFEDAGDGYYYIKEVTAGKYIYTDYANSLTTSDNAIYYSEKNAIAAGDKEDADNYKWKVSSGSLSINSFIISSKANADAVIATTSQGNAGVHFYKYVSKTYAYSNSCFLKVETTLSDLSNDWCYKILNSDFTNSRGYICANSDNNALTATSTFTTASDDQQSFVICKINGSYYLYNVAAQKVVKQNEATAELESNFNQQVNITLDSEGTWQLAIGGTENVNKINISSYIVKLNISSVDEGTKFYVLPYRALSDSEKSNLSTQIAFKNAKINADAVLTNMARLSLYDSGAISTAQNTISGYNYADNTESDIQSQLSTLFATPKNIILNNSNQPTYYMADNGTGAYGTTTADESAVWTMTYKSPYGFTLQNVKTGRYLKNVTSYNTQYPTTTDSESAAKFYLYTSDTNTGTFCFNINDIKGSDNETACHLGGSYTIVRWKIVDSPNSLWTIQLKNVVTYNHYFVPNASSTDGAEMIVQEKEAYSSGDEVTYKDAYTTSPITGVAITKSDDISDSKPEDGAISTDVTINYYYTAATLPFTTTSITDGVFAAGTQWYTMAINHSSIGDMPVYAEDQGNGTYMVTDNRKQSIRKELWCFVGNAASGVKIYNKKTGATKPLNWPTIGDGKAPYLSESTTNSDWKVTGTTLSDIKFSQESNSTTYYLNQYNGYNAFTSGWKVLGYTSGSAFKLTAVSDFTALETAATANLNTYLADKDKVGFPTSASTAYGNMTTAIATASSYPNNIEAYVAQQAALDSWLSSSQIKMPEEGKAYYIHNQSVNYLGYTWKYIYDVDGTITPTATNGTTDAYKFICHVASNGKGYMFAMPNGNQFIWRGSSDGKNDNKGETSLAEYNFTEDPFSITHFYVNGNSHNDTYGAFSIKGYRSAYQNSVLILKHSETKFDKAGTNDFFNNTFSSAWRLVEADYYNDVTFHSNGTDAYASIYLPFSTTIPSGVTAYAVTSQNGNYATMGEIVSSEGGTLPKETAAILVKSGQEEDETIYLSPAEAAGSYSGDNQLAGTVSSSEAVKSGTNYVLGGGNDGIALYKYTASYYAPGKAYLNIAAAGVKALVFDFGGATAIQNVNKQATSNAPIFDLSGRQIEKAQRGIYIQNGKKFIVK